MGVAAGAGAGVATRWALRGSWRAAFEAEPPDNPASPDAPWRSALVWAAVSGMCVGGARLIAKRLAADAFERVAGSPPPMKAGSRR
jgi:hypothetical protein